MHVDEIAVFHDQWVKSGRGLIEDSAEMLGSALTNFHAALSGAGMPFGRDAIGRAAFEGDGTADSPGFRAIRDDTITRLTSAVNALQDTGAGLMASGLRYADTEGAVVASMRGGGIATDTSGQRVPALDTYTLPPLADQLVRSVPPPAAWESAIALIESITVGCAYPDGDSEHVRQIQNAWDTMATVLDEVNTTANFYVGAVTRANSGSATDAFAAHATQLVGSKGELADLATRCRGLSQYCDLVARNIDAGRLRFGLSIEFVLVSLALAPLLGIAEGALLPVIEADGLTLRAFLMMCAKQVLIGAWLTGGLDAMGQIAQIEEHLQNGFNVKETLLAGAQGALAGLLMLGLHGGLTVLGGRSSALARLTGLMGSEGPIGMATRLAVGGTIGTVASVATEAMFNDGHVDVAQAIETGFGMAALGEAMEAGKNATSRFIGLAGGVDAVSDRITTPTDYGAPVEAIQQEAQQAADQYGAPNLRIDFSGMDAASARAITDGIRELGQQSPARLHDLNHIQSTDFATTFPDGSALQMDAYSITRGDARGVYLNTHSFGDSTALEARGAQQQADGYTVPGGGTAKGIFFHEIGHMDAEDILSHPDLRDALNDAVSTILGSPYDVSAGSHDLQQRAAIEEHLSIHGAMDPHQMIAEGSAEYRTADEPRPLAAAIGDVINQLDTLKQDHSFPAFSAHHAADENLAGVHARYTPPPEGGRGLPEGTDRLATKARDIDAAFERSRSSPGMGEKIAELLRGSTPAEVAIVRAHISKPELLKVLDWVQKERSDVFSAHASDGSSIEWTSIYGSESERDHWYSVMNDAAGLAADFDAANTARDPDAYEAAIDAGKAFVREHGLANVHNNNYYRFKGAAQTTDWEAFVNDTDIRNGIGFISDVLLRDFGWSPDDMSGFGDLLQIGHGGAGTPGGASDEPSAPGVYQKRGNRWWQKVGNDWQPAPGTGAAKPEPDEPPGPGAWAKDTDGNWRPARLPPEMRPQPAEPTPARARADQTGSEPARHAHPPANVPPPPPEGRARKPHVEEQSWGAWHATWRRDPMAMVFIEPKGSGVDVNHVARGNNPPRSAGQMIADTLRGARIKRPSAIRFTGIINKETLEELGQGISPGDTRLGRTAQRAAAELGGRVTGWSTGLERGKPWLRADIEYD